MDDNTEIVYYKRKKYAVMEINYKEKLYPLVLDWKDYKIIKLMKKKWRCNSQRSILCTHKNGSNTKEIFIHDIIKTIDNKEKGIVNRIKKPIIHLNRVNFDNRRVNLIYDDKYKEYNKNFNKKKRTINLPKESGIIVDEIPTYVWYLKENDSHGERFIVSIGDIKWKTSSSKKLSLRYKLEEAKKYLREIKHNNPEIFENYSMNGEYTKKGKELIQSFKKIVEKAGYKINQYNINNITETFLKPVN